MTPAMHGHKCLFMVARVQSAEWDAIEIHKLAVRIQQDRISVYSPDLDEGALIGPVPQP